MNETHLSSDSQRTGAGPAAGARPGNLSEIQILWPHPRRTEQNPGARGATF